MNSDIVADGESGLRNSPEFEARLLKLRAELRDRHAVELAHSGLFRRLIVRWRMAAEFRAERRKLAPSDRSLY